MSFDEQKILKYRDTTISTHETVDADHGRIKTRNYTVIHDVDWLQARHQWPGLSAVVVVESRRESNGKITNETRVNALLHHIAGDAGQRGRPDDPRALGYRELLALGHGHGLSRRRMPR